MLIIFPHFPIDKMWTQIEDNPKKEKIMKATCATCGKVYESCATELADFFGRDHGSITMCDDCYRAKTAQRHIDTLTDAEKSCLRAEWRNS